MSNGARLMVLEDHRVPPFSSSHHDWRRVLLRSAELPGLADTTATLMDEGTSTKTSEQIAQALDSFGDGVCLGNQGSQISRR